MNQYKTVLKPRLASCLGFPRIIGHIPFQKGCGRFSGYTSVPNLVYRFFCQNSCSFIVFFFANRSFSRRISTFYTTPPNRSTRRRNVKIVANIYFYSVCDVVPKIKVLRLWTDWGGGIKCRYSSKKSTIFFRKLYKKHFFLNFFSLISHVNSGISRGFRMLRFSFLSSKCFCLSIFVFCRKFSIF